MSTVDTWRHLLVQQETRAGLFNAWDQSFKSVLRGAMKADDYTDVVTKKYFPQLQQLSSGFIALCNDPRTHCDLRDWITRLQDAERSKYNAMMARQQRAIEHAARYKRPHLAGCPLRCLTGGRADVEFLPPQIDDRSSDDEDTDETLPTVQHAKVQDQPSAVHGCCHHSHAPPLRCSDLAQHSTPIQQQAPQPPPPVRERPAHPAIKKCASFEVAWATMVADERQALATIRELVGECQEHITDAT